MFFLEDGADISSFFFFFPLFLFFDSILRVDEPGRSRRRNCQVHFRKLPCVHHVHATTILAHPQNPQISPSRPRLFTLTVVTECGTLSTWARIKSLIAWYECHLYAVFSNHRHQKSTGNSLEWAGTLTLAPWQIFYNDSGDFPNLNQPSIPSFSSL